MNLIFVFLFLAVYAFIAKKRMDWAVMLILACLIAYLWRFKILGIPFTFLEGMVLVSFFVWFFTKTKFKDLLKSSYGIKDYFNNKKKRVAYPFALEVFLVITVAFLAAGLSGFSTGALGIWKAYFFEPILIFILVLNNFQDKKGFRKLVFSLAFGAFVVSLYAVIQKFTGLGISNEFWSQASTRRVTSFFGYPNALGLYLAPIMMVILGYLYKNFIPKRNIENAFFIATIVLSLAAIYFARSEGALIAVVGALFLFGLLSNKTSRIITGAFLIIVAGMLYFNQPIKEYAFKKATLMDLSGQIRRQQWTETWQMLKDGRLVTGAGLDNYQKAIEPYHQEGIFFNDGDPDFRRKIVIFDDKYKAEHWQPVEIYLYPHNLVLNFWTELGLAGCLIFIWLFLRFIYEGIRGFFSFKKDVRCRFLSLGLAGAFFTMVVHGLVDVPYFKNDLAIIFWVLAAMLGMINIKRQKERARNKVLIK